MTDVTSSPCAMTINKTCTPPPEILLVPADMHQIACNGQPHARGAHVVAGGGHPKVWYTFDGKDAVTCGYCDRLFTKTPGSGAVAYVRPADLDDERTVGFYNRALIDLSARAGDAHEIAGATQHGRAVSPICGSVVEVDLAVNAEGRITDFGYRLEACALTKSVVAVMRDAVIGATREDLRLAHAALAALLEGDEAAAQSLWPNDKWREMSVLGPLKDHRVRHNAMQLPFEAAEKSFAAK